MWRRFDICAWNSSVPKQLFLVASVDLIGDDAESSVAGRLHRLERELETDPYVVDALLTVSEPDDAGSQGR